jgi:amidase
MSVQSIIALSAIEIIHLIQKKQVTVSEVLEAFISRINEVQPKINALAFPMFDLAREKAHSYDKKNKKLPLFGLPITVKDHICVENGVSTFGLLGLKDNKITVNSTVAARLQDAGAIVMGMSNMAEFGASFETTNLIYGRTNNPYDLTRTAGGSSGGESALIAALASPLGFGTDAGGSVRIPAHYCGLVGLKPTRGRVPNTGLIPNTDGLIGELAHIGPMGRSVADVSLGFDVIQGADGFDPRCFDFKHSPYSKVNLKDLRIAYYSNANNNLMVEESTENAINNVIKCLSDACASVEEISSDFLSDVYPLWLSIFAGCGSEPMRFAVEHYFKTNQYSKILEILFNELDKPENVISVVDFQMNFIKWSILNRHFKDIFRKADVIISPVSKGTAPKHGETLGKLQDCAYTFVHNLTGLPCLVVRCGTSPTGLPIGVQITADFYQENICLAIGSFLEKIFNFRDNPQI